MGLYCILASGPTNDQGRPDQCFQIINVLELISSDQDTVQALGKEKMNERKIKVPSGLGRTAGPSEGANQPCVAGPDFPSLSAVLSPKG